METWKYSLQYNNITRFNLNGYGNYLENTWKSYLDTVDAVKRIQRTSV